MQLALKKIINTSKTFSGEELKIITEELLEKLSYVLKVKETLEEGINVE